MHTSSGSSAIRVSRRLWKVIDIVVILSIMFQNLVVTTSTAKAIALDTDSQPTTPAEQVDSSNVSKGG
jgi:hypothetical protein